MSNIVSITGEKKPVQPPSPTKYEIHMFAEATESNPTGEEVVLSEGFLRFSQLYVCIAETPEENSTFVFSVPANLVRYIKRVDGEGQIQGTLSL